MGCNLVWLDTRSFVPRQPGSSKRMRLKEGRGKRAVFFHGGFQSNAESLKLSNSDGLSTD